MNEIKNVHVRISLKACRANKEMTLPQAAQQLSKSSGVKITRQRLSKFENNPQSIPPIWANELASLYDIPVDYIDFERPLVNQ